MGSRGDAVAKGCRGKVSGGKAEVDTVRALPGPRAKNIAEGLPAPVRCASQQFAVLKAKISRRRASR